MNIIDGFSKKKQEASERYFNFSTHTIELGIYNFIAIRYFMCMNLYAMLCSIYKKTFVDQSACYKFNVAKTQCGKDANCRLTEDQTR